MKISELIEELNLILNNTGDIECVIYADHGQSYESVSEPSVLVRVNDDNEHILCPEEVDDETDEYDSCEDICVIYGS
jgi:hypothetical protein